MKTCFFTGHRPDKLGNDYDGTSVLCQNIKNRLREVIEHYHSAYGTNVFRTGMALGVDQWAAEVCVHLRDERGLDLDLQAYIPFVGQERFWPIERRRKYNEILSKCDKIITLKDRAPRDKREAAMWLKQRNVAMMQGSQVCIAVWDGSVGGTHHAVNTARSNGLYVLRIDPRMIG